MILEGVVPAVAAALVKRLRDETGATLMECKRALEDADGDYAVARQKLERGGEPDEPLPVE
jgi:translation elongation factor EF-Ts